MMQDSPPLRLLLCPRDYLEVLKLRQETFAKFQATIKGENLSDEQQKLLHAAIQGYFRDWFVRTN